MNEVDAENAGKKLWDVRCTMYDVRITNCFIGLKNFTAALQNCRTDEKWDCFA